jgi:hypothetical protein
VGSVRDASMDGVGVVKVSDRKSWEAGDVCHGVERRGSVLESVFEVDILRFMRRCAGSAEMLKGAGQFFEMRGFLRARLATVEGMGRIGRKEPQAVLILWL